MATYTHGSKYFYGNKISDYGLEHRYIDYRTLAKSFDCVLCNDIIFKTSYNGYEWELVNGQDIKYYDKNTYDYVDYDDIEDWDNIGEEEQEVFQYYIIDTNGYEILSDCTDELVWYNEALDLYVWGVTHFGTSWDYVLTDIKIELN